MSQMGHTRSFGDVGSMSALAHFADSRRTSPEVREVPIASNASQHSMHHAALLLSAKHLFVTPYWE
jgi:hypothetical protein